MSNNYTAPGSALTPSWAFNSDQSLGWYLSGASAIGLSYGQLQLPAGTATQPAGAYSSESSLGFYRSAASSIAQSYGTFTVEFVSSNTVRAPNRWFCVAGGTEAVHITNANLIPIPSGYNILWNFDNTGDIGAPTGLRPRAVYAGTAFKGPAGTALAPSFAISSESSLGWYRSAVSTLALSYGTVDLTNGGAVTSIASLTIKSGSNNACGTAVLGSNGSVNVANTYVKTGDLIFLTDQTPGGTLGDLEILGIRNSSGFTIGSTSVTDTSTVAWLIVRPG